MKTAKQLLEELQTAIDGVQEDTLQDVVPEATPELQAPKTEIVDEITVADKLAIKTKIARSLEYLKDAINDFREAALEKINTLNDPILLGAIEGLETQVASIESCLTQEIPNSPLNNVFQPDPVDTVDELEVPAITDEPEVDSEDKEIEDEDTESEEDFNDFDAEASLDLLGGQ